MELSTGLSKSRGLRGYPQIQVIPSHSKSFSFFYHDKSDFSILWRLSGDFFGCRPKLVTSGIPRCGLILARDAAQDLHSLLVAGLRDGDRLEAPLQGLGGRGPDLGEKLWGIIGR